MIWNRYRGLPSEAPSRPDQERLCLSCHVQPDPQLRGEHFAVLEAKESQPVEDLDDPAAVFKKFTVGISASDGVSCEVCHGAAKDWIGNHYSHEWAQMTAQEKSAMGFINTKNLVERARLCVGCHVGKEGMDVNHDLIAAGHPRLRFEMGAYLANYTNRHWSRDAEKRRYPELEEKSWLIGQLVSAKAAIDLMAVRAEAGTKERPWPELAEFNCASCHHRLGPNFGKFGKGNIPGQLPVWGTWYHTTPGTLVPLVFGPAESSGLSKDLTDFAQMVRNPATRPRELASRARGFSSKWEDLIQFCERMPYDRNRSRGILEGLTRTDAGELDWESATQRYLGMLSLLQTMKEKTPPQEWEPIEKGIKGLGKILESAFPSGQEKLADSPDLFDGKAVRDQLEQLRNILR